MLKHFLSSGLVPGLAFISQLALGATEITPFVGQRFASDIALQTSGAATSDKLRFESDPSVGILINTDIDGQGRQYQFYYSHQNARARPSSSADFGGLTRFDVAIDRLQVGGLYFPGGGSHGGFVDGTLGVTRLDPHASGLDQEYYFSIALGGGAKIPLNSRLMLRLDLRGIYTALNTDASIFCSGGCTARVSSGGFFQAEATVGLSFRF